MVVETDCYFVAVFQTGFDHRTEASTVYGHIYICGCIFLKKHTNHFEGSLKPGLYQLSMWPSNALAIFLVVGRSVNSIAWDRCQASGIHHYEKEKICHGTRNRKIQRRSLRNIKHLKNFLRHLLKWTQVPSPSGNGLTFSTFALNLVTGPESQGHLVLIRRLLRTLRW